MKKILIIIMICTGIFFLGGCRTEDDPATGTVSDAAFFSIPSSLTGDPLGPRAITADSENTVSQFYTYARDQVRYANSAAQSLKGLIAAVEASGILDYGQNIVLEASDNSGDIYRWTVGPGLKEYSLEWWRALGGGTYGKYLELKLDEFERIDDYAGAQGHVIVDPRLDDGLDSWYGDPDWVRIDFNSNDNGRQFMQIQMEGFLGIGLYDGGLYQNGIFKTWKAADGTVEVISSARVPGVDDINFELKNDGDPATNETRYYVFSGTSTNGKASIKLSMPDDTGGDYNESTVFDSDTVGDIIEEFVCDQLRADVNGGHASLDALAALGTFTAGSYENTTPYPLNSEIYTAVNTYYTGNPTDENVENLLYLMDVANPAFFEEQTFNSYNTGTTPAGFPTAFPVFDIGQNDVDTLSLNFIIGTEDIPPAVTQ